RLVDLNGHSVLVVSDEGSALARIQDVLDLIGEALPQGVSAIVVPVTRLDPVFFRLSSGFAGEFVQKIVNYRLRLAVIGDIAALTAGSAALADFVRESNRGRDIFFLKDLDVLAARLGVESQ
ncbi:MAG TPA: DUF4180 domain-containing protein, partial [Terriglobales bacterium]